jgi:hypothetical protein
MGQLVEAMTAALNAYAAQNGKATTATQAALTV